MKHIIFLIATVFCSFLAMGQNQRDAAAEQGLRNYRQLITLQQPQNDSLKDLNSLSLGPSISTAIIPLDRLRKYTAGQAANAFIIESDRVIYPIIDTRTNRITSTVTVEKTKDKWVPSAFGADKATAENLTLYTAGINNFKLVKIIALNLSFIGFEKDNVLQFIPMQNDPERNIVQGKAVAATKILETYVKAANDYNGLPL